jgi:hypothetical protein
MKKFLGFTAILYAVIAIASGLSVQQLQFPSASSGTDDSSVTASELAPFWDEDDTRSWNFVGDFSGAYQIDQLTTTPSFYIPGDTFRVSYNIKTECEDDSYVPTGNPFFYIEAREVVNNEYNLAGRVEKPYATEIIDSFPVNSGEADFYLFIWSVNCAEWEVTVESLY